MNSQKDRFTVFLEVAVIAFAIVLVDDRWVRVGLGLLPALLLAQRALGGAGVGGERRIRGSGRPTAGWTTRPASISRPC